MKELLINLDILFAKNNISEITYALIMSAINHLFYRTFAMQKEKYLY